MQTGKNPYTTPEMKEYYTSLPLFVQESIQQSGVKFDSVEQLQSFVEQLNYRK